MRRMLAGTLMALGLFGARSPLPAQEAGCCVGDTASPATGMHAGMPELDRRLEAKLAEVDRAKGDKKVAAMAEVVRELVAQRREMHEQMAKGTGAPGACRCGAMQGAKHGDHPMPGAGRPGGCAMHGARDSAAGP